MKRKESLDTATTYQTTTGQTRNLKLNLKCKMQNYFDEYTVHKR
jgi:hypothetical protein